MLRPLLRQAKPLRHETHRSDRGLRAHKPACARRVRQQLLPQLRKQLLRQQLLIELGQLLRQLISIQRRCSLLVLTVVVALHFSPLNRLLNPHHRF